MAISSPAWCEPGEQLLFGLPNGYKQINERKDKDSIVRVYRPETATNATWTEMLVTTTMPGRTPMKSSMSIG